MYCYDAHVNPDITEKRCPSCELTMPVSAFYPAGPGMYRAYCRKCTSAKRRVSYAANGGKDTPYEQLIKREYGITLDQYNDLLRRQAHRCAVCRRPETARSKSTGAPHRLSVDHDHVTGKVRGLLCKRCNILVWALEDNHVTLASIHGYIEDFRKTFM